MCVCVVTHDISQRAARVRCREAFRPKAVMYVCVYVCMSSTHVRCREAFRPKAVMYVCVYVCMYVHMYERNSFAQSGSISTNSCMYVYIYMCVCV